MISKRLDELRARGDSGRQQPVSCPHRGDDLVTLEGVCDIRDTRRKRWDVHVAGDDGDGTKLKALRERHDADERLVYVVPAGCRSPGR